jgi:sugar porter (SP) family MFS transporter
LFQLGIVTGIFVVFFCIREISAYGEHLDQAAGAAKGAWHNETGWRWMLVSEAVPAAPFLFLLLLVPESPRWLLQVGKAEKAKAILAKILGHDEADAEIRDIQAANSEGEAPFSHLFSKALRRPLVIACGLALFCQFCGINAIMYYAPKVFEGAEGTDTALKNAIWVGGVNFLATFIAIFCIDLIGRRPLLLIGSALQVVMLAITAWKVNHGETGSALLWPILGFIAAFAMAMGPLPWVIISEIFPGNIRGRAVSVGVGSVWVACALVALTFPGLMAKIGLGNTFFVYAGLSLASFFFVLFLLPETKGRTLEEISASWSKKA